MSIGIFYESEEWSNYEIGRIIESYGIDVEMINITKFENVEDINIENIELAINRMFPSGIQRGIVASSEKSYSIVELLKSNNIIAVNPLDSFKYDFSKILTYENLKKAGILVPVEYGWIDSCKKLMLNENFKYPCLIKPDCGGRSQNTYILRTEKSFKKIIKELPDLEFIIQEYIEPVKGFLTRVEMIDGLPMVVLKRTIGEDGLSSYHSGSRYFIYNDYNEKTLEISRKSLETLNIEMGSLDIIEKENGENIVIDVNSTSNFSKDNLEFLGFNPMENMAKFISERFREVVNKNRGIK